jgi:uncharacterized protein with WD repeat
MVTIPELRSIDCIFWSPAGQYCVLAQLLNLQHKAMGSGSLMFLDTGVNSSNPVDYKLCATEHPYATDVEWDPTGRYVVTYVSAWIRPSDNEYQVWSFLGRRIRKEIDIQIGDSNFLLNATFIQPGFFKLGEFFSWRLDSQNCLYFAIDFGCPAAWRKKCPI